MPSTQRLLTGRSAQFADQGGGGSMADSMLLKPFFVAQGFLPSNVFLEDLYNFPARDFENLSTGSIAVSMSRVFITTPNNNQLNFGFDMGASKSKVLAIVGMARPKTGGLGVFISDTLPADNLTKNAYQLQLDSANSKIWLYKTDGAGAQTELVSETLVGPFNSSVAASIAIALYYDDATGRLIVFVRYGSECWFPVLDTTDSTFTTMRYVAITCGSAGTPTMEAGCPIAIYNE